MDSAGKTGGLALLEGLRPRQWIKNLLVFAGMLFTSNLGNGRALLTATEAFIAFCAVSSAVYLLNDIVDRTQDQAHPKKRMRPIASGRLSIQTAASASFVLLLSGLAIGFSVRLEFGALAAGFALLNICYSFWLKHEVILDVLCIAAEFIARALGGAVALAVNISPWLLVCTALLALVMGFGKRRHELIFLDETQTHRRVLEEYSREFLNQLISSVAAATIVSYLLYTFQSDTARMHHWIPATIPFVMYGLFRYLYLIHQRGFGGAPEEVLFRDRPMLVTLLLWGATAAVAMAVR